MAYHQRQRTRLSKSSTVPDSPRHSGERDDHSTLRNRDVVISVGGGGVPVIREKNGKLRGVEAVLDKDRTAALLAKILGVETLLILTDVEKVFINYGKPNQRALDKITVRECRKYLAEGQFPSGSMGPKIESAVSFLSDST